MWERSKNVFQHAGNNENKQINNDDLNEFDIKWIYLGGKSTRRNYVKKIYRGESRGGAKSKKRNIMRFCHGCWWLGLTHATCSAAFNLKLKVILFPFCFDLTPLYNLWRTYIDFYLRISQLTNSAMRNNKQNFGTLSIELCVLVAGIVKLE